jgi:hypothetical protein
MGEDLRVGPVQILDDDEGRGASSTDWISSGAPDAVAVPRLAPPMGSACARPCRHDGHLESAICLDAVRQALLLTPGKAGEYGLNLY